MVKQSQCHQQTDISALVLKFETSLMMAMIHQLISNVKRFTRNHISSFHLCYETRRFKKSTLSQPPLLTSGDFIAVYNYANCHILLCLTSSEKVSFINRITHPKYGNSDTLEIIRRVIETFIVVINSI